MTWAKIDDRFFEHPKVIELPKDAKLLYLSALTYCTKHNTDGLVTQGALRVAAALVEVSSDEAATLVAARLWEAHEKGWMIHDFLEYQLSSEQVNAKKKARVEAGRKGGLKSAESKSVARLQADTQANAQANAQANLEQTAEQKGKLISTPSPSPSPSPYQDPDHIQEPPSAARRARRAIEELHPAIALYREGFLEQKGRHPVRNKPIEDRAIRLWKDQGEETYRRALHGFFTCLNGADQYPKTKGFDLAVFVRQFDTWEGGSSPPRLTLSQGPRSGADPNTTISDIAAGLMRRHGGRIQ